MSGLEPKLFLKSFHIFSSNNVNVITVFYELLIPAIYNSSSKSVPKYYMVEFL